MTSAQGRRTIVWLAPEQVDLVREVARAAELKIEAAGSPDRGRSQHVASELECAAVDDLRAAMATATADLLWIAAPGSFGTGGAGSEDASSVVTARSRGVRIATLEPIPATALDLVSKGWIRAEAGPPPVDAIRFCPAGLPLASPFDAADLPQDFGVPRFLIAEAICGATEGSLGARLYGVMELVHRLFGEPESIDAAYVSPEQGRGLHALPGETLRDLHGDLTANIRFGDGRAAAIGLSDQGNCWCQTVTLLGAGGRLRIDDAAFEWRGANGRVIDETKPRRSVARAGESPAVARLARSLRGLLDSGAPASLPRDESTVLAMCHAALLSARTGQGESPSTIKRIAGAM